MKKRMNVCESFNAEQWLICDSVLTSCLAEQVRKRSRRSEFDYHSLQEIHDTLQVLMVLMDLFLQLCLCQHHRHQSTVELFKTHFNIQNKLAFTLHNKHFARKYARRIINIMNIPRWLHITEREMGPLGNNNTCEITLT